MKKIFEDTKNEFLCLEIKHCNNHAKMKITAIKVYQVWLALKSIPTIIDRIRKYGALLICIFKCFYWLSAVTALCGDQLNTQRGQK